MTMRDWLRKKLLSDRILRTKRIDLKYKNILIHPTGQSVGLVFVLILCLIMAINYQNNLIYLLLFWAIALAVVSIHVTYRILYRLQVDLLGLEDGFSDGEIIFKIKLTNVSNRDRPAICIQLSECDEHDKIVEKVSLRSRESKTLSMRIPANKRGRYSLPDLELFSVYPFGLIKSRAYLTIDERCWVYPKPIEDDIKNSDACSENNKQQQVIDSDQITGFRRYQLGDASQRICWKQYARSNQLWIKESKAEVEQEPVFDWYQLPKNWSVEYRLSVLCQHILEASKASLGFRIQLPGRSISPVILNDAHVKQVLIELADFPAGHQAKADSHFQGSQ